MGLTCGAASQSNNVETDERGLIYVVDRANIGLLILELTRDARKAAGLPQGAFAFRRFKINTRAAPNHASDFVLPQPLQLVDHPLDHAQATLPERRLAGVEPERLQQFRVVPGA